MDYVENDHVQGCKAAVEHKYLPIDSLEQFFSKQTSYDLKQHKQLQTQLIPISYFKHVGLQANWYATQSTFPPRSNFSHSEVRVTCPADMMGI